MSTLLQDLRYGLRMLAKNPGFTAVAVLTLGLGIGANTAIFSVINGLLLHPVGMSDPSRLLAIRVKYDKLNLKNIIISPTDFADVRDSKQVFSSAAILDDADFTYLAGDLPERLLGAKVSWQWFDVFNARPLLGRTFRAADDQPGSSAVAVLAYGTWKQTFGGDASIVGRSIQLNQQPYRVIGVMGRDFQWPTQAQLWVPMGLPPSEYGAENRFNENYLAVAQIKPGVSVAQAEAFVKVLGNQKVQADPRAAAYAKDSGWGMFGVPLAQFVYGDLRTPMLILLGAVGFVLLIACANIAGLLLARASTRSKELTVRAALGADRWDLIRLTLAESSLLAAGGTLLGLILAQNGLRVLQALAPAEASGVMIRTDAYVLAFTVWMGFLSALLFGSAPAWQVSAVRCFEALKEGGRSGTASRGHQRVRACLVAGEVALALVLLFGAGLFLKSLARLQQVNPGFDPRGVMTGALSLPESRYKEPQKQIAFYRAVLERLRNLPGVESAAATAPLPFSGAVSSASFNIEGRPQAPGDPGPHSDLQYVTPGYFAVMRIPLDSGRVFTDEDREDGLPVVVIDENLARQYWPNQDPVGRRLRRGNNSPWATIIGVVGHVDRSTLVGDTGKGLCYYPLAQQPHSSAFLIARTTADPSTLATPLRAAVEAVDSAQPVYDLLSMRERVLNSLGPRRFAVVLLGFFAAVAVLLAALGLYGVVSYAVTQRTQEFGIRMALGAQRSEVLRLVLKHGMKLASAGALAGLLISVALARLLASQLYEAGAFDLLTFALTALILALVALLACYVPARRATRVDPMEALRYE